MAGIAEAEARMNRERRVVVVMVVGRVRLGHDDVSFHRQGQGRMIATFLFGRVHFLPHEPATRNNNEIKRQSDFSFGWPTCRRLDFKRRARISGKRTLMHTRGVRANGLPRARQH